LSVYLVIFGKPRYLGFVEMNDLLPAKGSHILAESMRGVEMGIIAGPLTSEQQNRFLDICSEEPQDGQPKGGEPMLQNVGFISFPSDSDLEDHENNQIEEHKILVRAREILRGHDISMKLVDVEYMLDRKKLFFYFTSDQRVDFRAYVRDLAREFKTRIELRQIGVRDEAKVVKGLGPCGQVCCCSYWLHSFTPICIKMVKEQNLALNPTKISGICGRLMCCMCYEHPMYKELWTSLPNPGTKLKTSKGNFVVLGVDLGKKAAKVRCPDGPEILVSIDDFGEFRECVMNGRVWEKIFQEEEQLAAMEPMFYFGDTKADMNRKRSGESDLTSRPGSHAHPKNKGRKSTSLSDKTSKEHKQPSSDNPPKKRRRKKKNKGDSTVKKKENQNQSNIPDKNDKNEKNDKTAKRRKKPRRNRPPKKGQPNQGKKKEPESRGRPDNKGTSENAL